MSHTPSKTSVAKAREALVFRKHKKGREYFRPTLIRGNRVEFLYGGYTVIFVLENGRVGRVVDGETPIYLTPEDYTLLACEATILMQACFNGYKKVTGKKRNRTTHSTEFQLKLL
jgi:hypothetical protein